MRRFTAYGLFSCLFAATALYSAYQAHQQFYPMFIHLSRSSASVMALLNFVIFLALVFSRAVQLIFFGPLRVIEVEHLYERVWFTISESFLAMSVFRDEFNSRFVLHFTLLLMSKCFHWLLQDRVDFMEMTPNTERGFHVRAIIMAGLLSLTDLFAISYAYHSLTTQGPSMQIMFGFEYMILLCSLFCLSIKYAITNIDHRRPMENKSTFMFYIQIFEDFVKLTLYLGFFGVILAYYGLPIHIIRDLYLTMRSFFNRIKDFIQFRRATSNMDERYPSATAEELNATDKICIICREEMGLGTDPPKKLPCGHLFHFRCLRSWLERQQSCPTCRRSVLEDTQSSTAQPPVQAPAENVRLAQPAQVQQPAFVPPGIPNLAQARIFAQPAPAQQPGAQQQQHQNIQARNPETSSPLSTITSVRLIPLVPPPLPQQQIAHGRWPNFQIPTEILNQLSHEDLRKLSGTGREQLIERIRMLERLQEEISSTLVRGVQLLSFLDSTQTAESVKQATTDENGIAGSSGSSSSSASSGPSTSKSSMPPCEAGPSDNQQQSNSASSSSSQ